MFSTSSFLSNHYTLEKYLHPSLLLNFRPSFSVLSRDCRLSPALSLPYGSTAIRVAALVVSKMISQQRQNRRKEDAHRNFQRLLSLTASKTTALRTKQRHLEDTCASKPFRNPVGHLCLAEHSHHTLGHEGLNGHTAPVADIEHTLHSSSSFSLSLFIRKDVSVWHSSLTWLGWSAQGRCWMRGCLVFPSYIPSATPCRNFGPDSELGQMVIAPSKVFKLLQIRKNLDPLPLVHPCICRDFISNN